MPLNENTRYWIDRMRAEVAAIPEGFSWVIGAKHLAQVEFAYGLDEAARATVRSCLDRFDEVKNVWARHIGTVAELCVRLGTKEWLDAEMQRGREWLSQEDMPENWRREVREAVHDLAVQTGHADIAAELVSDEWPGRTANTLIDACGVAGWTRNVSELQRQLPLARAAIAAAGRDEKGTTGNVGYRLVPACIASGWLAALPELCEAFASPEDEAAIALWSASDQPAYARVRDGWLKNGIEHYRAEPDGPGGPWYRMFYTSETIRCLGDVAGHRAAAEQIRAATADCLPPGTSCCEVYYHLAVLFARAGESGISAEYLDAAKRMFKGKQTAVGAARGNRSSMALALANAYQSLGETQLALEFARKCTRVGDREDNVLRLLILGGPVDEAEDKLATDRDDAWYRASTIGDSLMFRFRIGLWTVLCRNPDQ